MITCTLVIRILFALAGPVAAFLAQPGNAAFMIYLETGRMVKPQITPNETAPAAETTQPTQPQAETTEPSTEPPAQIQFYPEDTELIQVSNLCDYALDLEELLLSRLELNTPLGEPAVLIIHSHATESYTQTEQYSYKASAAYRTLDSGCNMIRVGQTLKEALESYGIQVIHDQTLHDYPSYTESYINSRETVAAYLQAYPSLCLVIDLHRDAAETPGGQLETAATVQGASAAQLMMVVGTDAGGRSHTYWEKNMALAVKLHAQLEKLYPGICRPISFRKERFNQDLSPGAMLIEVGAAGDTMEEALVATEALAEGIALLLTADSTS